MKEKEKNIKIKQLFSGFKRIVSQMFVFFYYIKEQWVLFYLFLILSGS
jgi:hypothetical protein